MLQASAMSRTLPRRCIQGWMLAALAALAIAAAALAHPAESMLSGPQLVPQLRAGGYVLVMRHAESPAEAPSARTAEPDNPHHERQLDATGKTSARALGEALRALRIPVGRIYSSPTYRARQTVALAQLGTALAVPALTEGQQGMASRAEQSQTTWLRRAVAQSPPSNSNTLIVTHTPNIVGAFGQGVADIKAGEMIVFKPGDTAGAHLVGRITIDQWQQLSQQLAPH